MLKITNLTVTNSVHKQYTGNGTHIFVQPESMFILYSSDGNYCTWKTYYNVNWNDQTNSIKAGSYKVQFHDPTEYLAAKLIYQNIVA